MGEFLSAFKAYDVRGRIPDELNDDIAYAIGRAYADYLKPQSVVIGYDIRLTSHTLSQALARGLQEGGADVIDIGQCGTEEVYFATSHLQVDGGICVTASHNPKDYNGMKFVREQSKPISGDTGLKDIERIAHQRSWQDSERQGSYRQQDTRPAYIQHLLEYVDTSKLKPLKIVCNAGNGGAGAVIDAIESQLPFEWIKVHHQADGEFPNGVPNPLLEENRAPTIEAIQAHQADLGIAWDGDFDRCFFFDGSGAFVEGYYIVGLLAEAFLHKHPAASIVHDPRLVWNTAELVESMGGQAIQSKTGHAFIKERMRKEDAVYGGEMSAHHYFRDFAYCDSGMIPWLLVAELISVSGKSLGQLVQERTERFPCSGEINSRLQDAKATLAAVEQHFADQAVSVDHTDGLSMTFEQWRFNLRASNTEPVVRLNVESRADQALMQEKTDYLLALMANA
ncbi:phosphomannomutase [Bacterioplanes sanyensis]|uniref:phosphomannomutase n=1 Tax=Bacterioplanes sanyensis TaxID=1249553 RepID=A0A222FKC0_9GAMM|nr:phosphomannomutase [Bacterioplanes sanyensis]ASP39475.1 phosphomannomutase [Bacterioplanes sanyensis]